MQHSRLKFLLFVLKQSVELTKMLCSCHYRVSIQILTFNFHKLSVNKLPAVAMGKKKKKERSQYISV